tara:strand:- start:536 stop:751 length:216 start_codon:yes stop_codon:yes gene_type:complete
MDPSEATSLPNPNNVEINAAAQRAYDFGLALAGRAIYQQTLAAILEAEADSGAEADPEVLAALTFGAATYH